MFWATAEGDPEILHGAVQGRTSPNISGFLLINQPLRRGPRATPPQRSIRGWHASQIHACGSRMWLCAATRSYVWC